MSRHHVLPPIIYTPQPPKPKETRRRRGIDYVRGKSAAGEADEVEEAGEVSTTRPAQAAQPRHNAPIEAAERRIPSTTGKLSAETLKTMLEVQEQESAPAAEASAKADNQA
ncbi:hypothetical protein [Bradyrhizobium sp. NP1]|uniref:hypothetical protein n=1 Tax=Bradyrhizobium sp. NP1 TaxID=3049772 RepID=UPI0025A51ABF|nr:hypothetical protein [Bradyrhizobium sp. NP1]WJR77727.1 hypothetical protein QOU61_34315 [Bradyrhizobium sp. NP1]